MTGLFNYVLWVGAAISFVAYGIQSNHNDKSNMYLGIVLVLLVIMTGSLSYYISSKSDDLMAQFKNFIPPKAFVFRGGVKMEVDAINLVPGDIVEVQIGDNIPADLVLLKTSEMKVNNASLTGESEELLRIPDEKHANIFESPNVAFFGTACTNGNGVGIVFKTGDATIIGQIASLASSAEVRETTLQRDINIFIKIVGVIAVGMGIMFFIIDIILGYSISTNIVLMIGIVTGNIPEGLLITLTVTLALAARRMADVKVLVKNMQSVETLGSTSCICSDKTGTLTQNRMTVSHLFYNAMIYEASVNYEEYKKNPGLEQTYNIND